MKSKLYPVLVLSALLLCSCTGKNNSSSSEDVPETYDSYEDVLPAETKDGNILHAFCWTFNQIKTNLPAIKEAGYKSVQTSPVTKSKSNASKWEFFYQPVSFSIAESSPLGTKDELKSLCDEAEKLGISIIVDVVFNHMATTGGTDSYGLPDVDPEVNTYEPYIYTHQDECFHHITNPTGPGTTTMVYSGLPDLNTGSSYIQERALSLLKECIDVGVDGFRFDAAKHIETSSDSQYASNFWENTLGVAKEYYKTKTGKELYAYGEILNDLGDVRGDNYDMYSQYFDMTDNNYINDVKAGMTKKSAETIISAAYTKKDTNTTPENLVTWVESHDTDLPDGTRLPNTFVAREWAVIGSRKGSRSLFYVRPKSQQNPTVGEVGSYEWKSQAIAVTNRFHNRFVGAEEDRHAEDNCYVTERYSSNDAGALLIDVANKGTATIKFNHLADGTYWDAVTGTRYVISGGKATVNFDSCQIMVLTKTKKAPHPVISFSSKDIEYVGTTSVTITVTNATSATYQIDDAAPVSFTDKVTITIGNSQSGGDVTSVKVSVSNADYSISETGSYTKQSLIEGYFNILNLDSKYYTDYSFYYWAFGGGSNGIWLNTYTVQNGVLLIDFKGTSYTGFVFGIFTKGYVISNVNKWDNNIIKQSADCTIANGFYNASGF